MYKQFAPLSRRVPRIGPLFVLLCSEESLAAMLHSYILLVISSTIIIRECLLIALGNDREVTRGLEPFEIGLVLLSIQSLPVKISQRAFKAVCSKALLDETA